MWFLRDFRVQNAKIGSPGVPTKNVVDYFTENLTPKTSKMTKFRGRPQIFERTVEPLCSNPLATSLNLTLIYWYLEIRTSKTLVPE